MQFIWDEEDHIKGNTYLKLSLEEAQKINYRNGIARAYQRFSVSCNNQDRATEAMIFVDKGLSILNSGADPDKKEILTKASLLLMKGIIYYELSNISKSSYYNLEALKIYDSEAEKNKKEAVDHMNKNGVKVSMQSLSGKDVQNFRKKFPEDKAYQKIVKRGGRIIKDQGNTYLKLGNNLLMYKDYNTALFYLQKARYSAEFYNVMGKYNEILDVIGNLFKEQKRYDSAVVYYKKSYKQNEMQNNLGGLIMVLQWTADAQRNNNPREALACYEKIKNLLLPLKTGQTEGKPLYAKLSMADTTIQLEFAHQTALNADNISQAYLKLGSPQDIIKAKRYQDSAITYYENVIAKIKNDKERTAELSYELGEIYCRAGKYSKAIHLISSALPYFLENKNYKEVLAVYENLAEAYEKNNDVNNAFKYYKKHFMLKDSLYSQQSGNEVAELQKRFEAEKKDADIDLMNKAQEVQSAELEKQKLVRNGFMGGFAIVMALAFIIFRSLRQNKKAHKIIEHQKHMVDEKHKEITDSINYAERIQRSFLASKQMLDENLKDYFVLFQPKDVVSGDFYWASFAEPSAANGQRNLFYLVTADSTGHGVPGAIMSILNISSLESAIKDGLNEPAQILNHTRLKIIERLKKDGSLEGGKDGMDCSFISFDFKNKKMIYAAANNPVWIVRHKPTVEFIEASSSSADKYELLEYAPDKMPVGKHDKDSVSFKQHVVELQKGDVIYALTDGMPDQFGGPNGKKFMYKQLKKFLVSISQLPMQQQQEKLSSALNHWKGNLEQVDDVLVIGIKI